MDSGSSRYIYMDSCIADSYCPFTQSELILFYYSVWEYQQSKKLDVCIDINDICEVISRSTKTTLAACYKFVATSPFKPFLIGSYQSRNVEYFIRYGCIDAVNHRMYIYFNDNVKTYFNKTSDKLLKINISLFSDFLTLKDISCYKIKIYQALANEYNRFGTEDYMYIPLTMNEMYMLSGSFCFEEQNFIQDYKEGRDISDICNDIVISKHNSFQKMNFSKILSVVIEPAIETINSATDLFIEGVKPIKYIHSVKGMVFKVKRNSKKCDYNDICRNLTKEDMEVFEKCRQIYYDK